MVVIRLARYGKKSHPTYRLIVSDKQKDTLGKYLEQVGTYNPHSQPPTVEVKTDRITYWLSVGAKPSPTVHNLLVEKGVLTSTKLVIAKARAKEAPAEEAKPAAAPAAAPVEAKAEEPKAEAPAEEKTAA